MADQLLPEIQSIDWNSCLICQVKTEESLTCPLLSKRTDINTGAGYKSLVDDLTEFKKIATLPKSLLCFNFDVPDETVETLIKFQAKWHKSCRSKYNKLKLQRTQKRKSDVTETNFIPNKREKRGKLEENVCIFCNEGQLKGKLSLASTFKLDKKVRELAERLQDTALLAKLSAGDMIAIDAKYHGPCLTKFYNRARDATSSSDYEEDMANAMVFAELISHIEERTCNADVTPIFVLAELTKLYQSRLSYFGYKQNIHSTRLKEKLLNHFPDMVAYSKGRDILLTFKEHVGKTLFDCHKKSPDQDAQCLSKAAGILRAHIFDHKRYEFNGSFSENSQDDSIPKPLLEFVEMVLEGVNIENPSYSETSLTVSQLIKFNTFKKRRKDVKSDLFRHTNAQETPLPIYLGLLLHAKTRKRDLVDKFFDLGISISYNRVLELSTQVADSVCMYYNDLGMVCPPNLKGNVFTTAAVDNIDHNPSSTTAKDSFHGTGISIFQHRATENEGTILASITDIRKCNTQKITPLPESYTNIEPVQLNSEYEIPVVNCLMTEPMDIVDDERQSEYSWLRKVLVKTHGENPDDIDSELTENETTASDIDWCVSWAAHHASTTAMHSKTRYLGALLPLFPETAHSDATILHAMKVVKQCTNYVNPGQTPVLTCDQPLFAIAKTIQWKLPENFGEDKFVILLGGLHIEMCFLKVVGQWLEASGWTDALVEADVATSGRAESFIHASHVSRTRYAHQVTAASLYILQRYAYEEYSNHCEEVNVLEFSEWCSHQMENSPQFAFWALTLELELDILMFIRSLRTSNFQLYIQTLIAIIPWVFALDHTNYSRWLSIHIRDMTVLPQTHPQIHKEFQKGNFTITKSNKVFSNIPIDQAHEQNNAIVKDSGGAIGLTENPTALLRWMVAGPEISRVISEFANDLDDDDDDSGKHHEQVPSTQNRFTKHVHSLVTTINESGNPFSEQSSTDLFSLINKEFADESVLSTLKEIKVLGKKQYKAFVDERILKCSKKINEVLPRNKLSLFGSKPKQPVSKEKMKAASIKNDTQLFSKLYIGTQNRDGNLDEFFSHENQAYPPSISEYGKLRQTSKSDLMSCLEKMGKTMFQKPQASALVIDGAVLVQMLKPSNVKTFTEYSQNIFLPFITSQLHHVSRIDLVWDVYIKNSLKSFTRTKRGRGIRKKVVPDSRLPQNWQNFLRDDENKTELFKFLAQQVSEIKTEKEIVVTIDNEVVCIPFRQDVSTLCPCTHEEADTRLLLHVKDLSVKYKTVMIKSVDTDVVVIAIAMFHAIELEELWIQFGSGKNLRYIPVHQIANNLGPAKSNALLTFHAFTGCDNVSSFSGRGKKTAWDTWSVFAEVTPAFLEMQTCPFELSAETLSTIERYVVLLYDRTSNEKQVNASRKQLFTKKGRSLDSIPPTYAALMQHIRRSSYQSKVWAMALVPSPVIPSPINWGWIVSDGFYQPLWTTIPEAAKSCYELIHCGCKKSCSNRCKCIKASLPCTALCACDGYCYQNNNDSLQ